MSKQRVFSHKKWLIVRAMCCGLLVGQVGLATAGFFSDPSMNTGTNARHAVNSAQWIHKEADEHGWSLMKKPSIITDKNESSRGILNINPDALIEPEGTYGPGNYD